MITHLSPQPTVDKTEIETVIKNFVAGADAQDAEMLASALHKESQQYYVGPEGLVRLAQPAYLDLINQKKIGGSPRELDIESVQVNGTLAMAKVKIWNSDMHFENYVSLMKVDDRWQIMSIILQLEMKSK